MPLIALKIDVDTCRGTREGVPALVRLLKKHGAGGTFLFSLGPDHTGWALRRALRPGFFRKVARTSVLEHYGFRTLMYGVLLPAPDIGKVCAEEMRAVHAASFECGIHSWDHVVWQDNVRTRDAAWTRKQLQQSIDRFHAIFGHAPSTHGAAGWQMNEHAYALLDEAGMAYASDGRARLTECGILTDSSAGPHRVSIAGKVVKCIQLPTTLPTLDELLGRSIGGRIVNASNAAALLLDLTARRRDHVFTLHAELEGQKFTPVLEQLLGGWREQGYDLGSMADYYQTVKHAALPLSEISWGHLPGRSGEMIIQSGSSQ
ncbi:MAG TPA: polysaccharide deacetylase family protein [Noviherbaspirillum sp.]|nr:polysaccharide deacetylase family protein [Noviherbaspirillum sp.]